MFPYRWTALDPRANLRDLQLTRLKAGAEPQDLAETLRLVAPVQALPDTHRLPLLDLAMPARQMSPRQYRAFRAQVELLMIAVDWVAVDGISFSG
jgi:hypothetical protein